MQSNKFTLGQYQQRHPKAKGRLFPFGIIYILTSAKKSKQLDLFLEAVRQEFQGHGFTALLAISLFNFLKEDFLD